MIQTKTMPKKTSKTLGKQYQKKDLHNHIYDTPDTYVGGCDLIEERLPLYNQDGSITYQDVEFIPALYNIFNEILVNARDQVIRLQTSGSDTDIPVKSIRVEIDESKGSVSVYNDGSGIDVVVHPTETKNGKPLYIPEMIFGHLLTSTNYDKDETKVVGGKNGYGAKLTNIFSKKFRLETVDHIRQKKYTQDFADNMKVSKKPKITDYDKKPYTRITWTADFERFGVLGYSDSMIRLMKRRVYDIAGITDPKVSVSLNKKVLKVKTFSDYAKLYQAPSKPLLSATLHGRWTLCVSTSDDKFEQVSFVNGISTCKGGKHVDTITKMLTSSLKDHIKKRAKRDVNESYIKNYLKIYLDCMIENPSFDSQTKERLITTASKFGSKPEIPDKFYKQILDKTDLLDKVLQFTEFKQSKELKKSDGRKRSKIRDIPKLDDANWAGTKKSEECTLILTEGDSAKTMAISGLSVVGRDRYGVFPLRGKVLNVKDAPQTQIANNSEVTNLKKILGLESGKIYKDTKSLRYGSVMIMTDQDHDGSHIKGLLMNLFHTLWPSLLTLSKPFLTAMITPIVKVKKGKIVKSFYTMTDYEAWQESTPDSKRYHIKYYKGLGTSSASEARDYFRELKITEYEHDSGSDASLELAFRKSEADKRKSWLYQYDHKSILNHNDHQIKIQEFINKELIHFSNSDTHRSIGSVFDGLKPSQRKIIYACLKRNLYKEIKVAQLSGYVSETAAYHHGEASLQGTIIGLAQNFVGSNNLNLLMPNGQFGTRIQGGHDSASPRYIHTELNPIVSHLFPKADMNLLQYNVDDGQSVEPIYYLPIIPMVLVNGMNGIGTGFSSHVPQYSVREVTENIMRKISGEPYKPMIPSYKGFRGKIIPLDDKTYLSKGIYRVLDDQTIEITELPIGKWTDDYKKFLDSLIAEEPGQKKSKEVKKKKSKYTIVDYINNSSDTRIHFTISLPKGMLQSLQWSEDPHIDGIEKYFKLTTTKGLSLNNIHLYNDKQQIQRYESINDILDAFYKERYNLYVERKQYQLHEYEREIMVASAKIRFLQEVMGDQIIIYKRKREQIIGDLRARHYPQYKDKDKIIVPEDQQDEDPMTHNYDYLVKMSILSFTSEELQRIQSHHDTLVKEYTDLQQTSESQLWSRECEAFLESLK